MSDTLRTLRSAARRSATLEDVARAAGVSRATASRVVNGVRNVDPAIQESVRLAIASTGYVPNGAARSLVTRRAGAVALVISGAGPEPGPRSAVSAGSDSATGSGVFTDPFFGRVVSGVFTALHPRGLHPVLMLAHTPEAREQVLGHLRQGNADGALVVPTDGRDPLPALLAAAGVPTVLFGRPESPLPLAVGWVDLANHDGGRLAGEHLAARGRRRPVTITGPLDVRAGRDRLAGFRDAAARLGMPRPPHAEGDFGQESGERAMVGLLREHPGLDGVFAANDLMAQGALAVLRDYGRRVPQDVALVGFDDSSPAVTARPQLTTVRQPVEEMAAEAARILLDRLADPGRGAARVVFEPTLIIRQSS